MQAFAWFSDLLVEHAEIFWSLFAVDMDQVLTEQPPDTWDSFPLFQIMNDYLRTDGKWLFTHLCVIIVLVELGAAGALVVVCRCHAVFGSCLPTHRGQVSTSVQSLALWLYPLHLKHLLTTTLSSMVVPTAFKKSVDYHVILCGCTHCI
jgi:hypothetical protein